ncbi:MAG TPA: bL17 family ribosomal protein [Candidatus Dojkabacteria bacterium]|nr:bL17 family ribosomal protein [Candidatus Dojkabacteria bacterium]
MGKTKKHREGVKLNLLNSLILYEHVKTTKQKAHAVLGIFDKIVNIARNTENALTRERRLKQILNDNNAVNKLQEVLVNRFAQEKGGYLKVYNLGRRKGDNAQLVNILVKGYVYKDIGKKLAKKEKAVEKPGKPEAAVEEKPQQFADVSDVTGKSQVSGAVQQGKVKSRSGI